MQSKTWHIALFPKTVKVSSFPSVFAKLGWSSASCRNRDKQRPGRDRATILVKRKKCDSDSLQNYLKAI